MRQFYEAWSNLLIWQPAAAEIQSQAATQLLHTPSRLDFSRDVFEYAGRTPKGASGRTAIERVAFW